MEEEQGLRQTGELSAEGFESLYNNNIGFNVAYFCESHHNVYGGSASNTAYPVFVQCSLDEFDTDLVASITNDDEGDLVFETTVDFDYQVSWILGELFNFDSFAEIARAGSIEIPIPTMVVLVFYCPDPATFEDKPAWIGRFVRDEYLAMGQDPKHAVIRKFISRGLQKNAVDAAALASEFGGGDSK